MKKSAADDVAESLRSSETSKAGNEMAAFDSMKEELKSKENSKKDKEEPDWGDSSTYQSDSGNGLRVQRDSESDEDNYRHHKTPLEKGLPPKATQHTLPQEVRLPYILVSQKDSQTPRIGKPEDRQICQTNWSPT